MPRFLVVGATGMTGRHVVRLLLEKHGVHIYSTNNAEKIPSSNVGTALLKDNYGNILPQPTHINI